ncbi:hypothetical protein [Streptomyces sp. NPDC057238]|uniref:hypothetical protein n=1 Tax=Streptomyces sp. NPDC057238 TaxID=3346060 RepID=UPI00362D2E2C
MSETITECEAAEKPVVESAAEAVSDEQLIAMLVDRARSDGLQLTKRVLELVLIERAGCGVQHGQLPGGRVVSDEGVRHWHRAFTSPEIAQAGFARSNWVSQIPSRSSTHWKAAPRWASIAPRRRSRASSARAATPVGLVKSSLQLKPCTGAR